MIKLIDLVDDIYKVNLIEEQSWCVAYNLMENVNLTDVYTSEKVNDMFYTFTDSNKVKHFDRLFDKLGFVEIKIGWYDSDGKPKFDKPPITKQSSDIQRPEIDFKVLNTHMDNVINKIIPSFLNQHTDKVIDLPCISDSRFRLFKRIINKFINKQKYKVDEFRHENLMKISLIK